MRLRLLRYSRAESTLRAFRDTILLVPAVGVILDGVGFSFRARGRIAGVHYFCRAALVMLALFIYLEYVLVA